MKNTKVIVGYKSITGHSKKIANAIAHHTNAQVCKIDASLNLSSTDLLILVAGIYGDHYHATILNFLKTLDKTKVKHVALITSSASGKTSCREVKDILAANGIKLVAEHYCIGNFLFMRLGHPNKREILSAVDFAQNTIKAIAK